ncbi:MAG TPA: hypothetical protein VKA54_06500 [Gemmatimonadaceae bacterium]|nr:hypothetical protein [Gemmatimonadaceae bacterium]
MLREFRARLIERVAGTTLAAAVSLVPIVPTGAQSASTACHARHYAAYANAQRQYQRTVERVLTHDDSSLRELAALARAEQIARIDARQRAVESLLATSPALVRVDRPVNQWLDSGRAESERLSRSDSVYARLDSTARAAAERVRGHPLWPRVRQAMRDRVQPSPEHRVALDRLTAAMHAAPRCGK